MIYVDLIFRTVTAFIMACTGIMFLSFAWAVYTTWTHKNFCDTGDKCPKNRRG
jgi:hypothetical protein|uniref:Uncharacterized protein n=1 Tax=uncultured marine virus TaxID=186617 RepID=A0A0F7L3K3_9VIRU|nr:hypothetical protein [uncultured marine virus]